MKRLARVVRWVMVLFLVIQTLGCAAFLEDYTYNPLGSEAYRSY